MSSIGLADFKAMWATHRQAFLDAADRVGKSGWLVLGSEVESFERELAAYWRLPFAVGVASGLDALEIAFRCEGMKPGDRVLTTPLSAFATTLAIVRVGAIPVFVDVDESGLMDLGAAERAVSSGPVPKFVVPVHLFGHAMNLASLSDFAGRHQLTVIEDCAQAIGAKSNGQPVGTASRVCATSFYPTKNLGALGDGGALLTSDETIAKHARSLRDYGQSEKYLHVEMGLNSRLDELQAALLRSVQLPMLGAQTERRLAIADRYLRELNADIVRCLPVPGSSQSVWHLFPVTTPSRDALKAHLKKADIHAAVHYPTLIPDQPAMKQVVHEVSGKLTNANRLATNELSLPIHPWLSDDDVSRVIAAVNSFEGQS